jgi:hypothetical protein
MKQVLFILLVFISFRGFSQSVKIGRCDSLEVMETDLGTMTWEDAKKACEELGDGWRLPTIDELQFMYNKRAEIDGLGKIAVLNYFLVNDRYYWSSTEYNNTHLWIFNFHYGTANADYYKSNANCVRAVRDLK